VNALVPQSTNQVSETPDAEFLKESLGRDAKDAWHAQHCVKIDSRKVMDKQSPEHRAGGHRQRELVTRGTNAHFSITGNDKPARSLHR